MTRRPFSWYRISQTKINALAVLRVIAAIQIVRNLGDSVIALKENKYLDSNLSFKYVWSMYDATLTKDALDCWVWRRRHTEAHALKARKAGKKPIEHCSILTLKDKQTPSHSSPRQAIYSADVRRFLEAGKMVSSVVGKEFCTFCRRRDILSLLWIPNVRVWLTRILRECFI